MGKDAPTTPSYVAPASYTSPGSYQSPGSYDQASYTSPAAYQAPPNPASSVPQVYNAAQIAQQGSALESTLPQWLQLNSAPLSQDAINQYQQNYYAQNEAPQLAQAQTAAYNSGQAYGSYGGGLVGQQAATGQLAAYNAAINYGQQLFNDQISGRQSYYAGGDALAQAQNNANVSRGLNVAQLQSQNAQNQNQYNLSSANSLNSFNQSNAQGQNSYNLSSSGAANSYDLASAGAQNSYNLSTDQNANNFNQQSYTGQLNAYNTQQKTLFGSGGLI